jgi:hypothetical protein
MWPEILSWPDTSQRAVGWLDPKTVIPIVISVIALFFTFIPPFFRLKDRRPRLLVPHEKLVLTMPTNCTARASEVAFLGGVEVYNLSGRSNAIRGYEFWRQDNGKWVPMESQNYMEHSEDGAYLDRNPSPFTLPPYSGEEVRVLAFTSKPQHPKCSRSKTYLENGIELK